MDTTKHVCIQTRHIEGRGGLEKWARLISEGFAKRHAAVSVISSDPTERAGCTISLSKKFRHARMKEFDHACRKWHTFHRPDIIFGIDRTSEQTHLRAGNGVHAAYLRQRQKYENYSSLRSFLNPLNRTILDIEKKGFENPRLKVLFTNSHMVKRQVLEHYRVAPEKIEVIHNGVEWHQMEEPFSTWVEKKPQVAQMLGLNPSDYHFLFVGNGYERKGLSLLLKAMARLERSDVHLSVVGKEKNVGPFHALANKFGLSSRVHFFGPSSNLIPFYQLADSLVIPSLYDPFANVTVEGLGMGLFVVSSKYNGGHEVLKENAGCTIDTLQHSDAITAALQRALDHPKTWIRSQEIRGGVKYLDLSNQLTHLIDTSLKCL